MTAESSSNHMRYFAQDRLPWVIIGLFLAVFLVTINPGFTLASLPLTANVAGWDTQPLLHQPLLYLVTLPFRWLPARWIPLALNGVTALCAALTLGLLARSVALLPMDRLPRLRALLLSKRSLLVQTDAWVPPTLAVVACGLQLSCWEHATAATGEMLDLLLFAYIVRCLLEYRIDPRQGWLDRVVLVCGLGMANNWAMVCFSPLFLIALIWMVGIPLSEPRRLVRLGLFAFAGLSIYLIVPLVYWLHGETGLGFWKLLKSHPGGQKSIVIQVFKNVIWPHRSMALTLASLTLIPLLVMSIRWSSRSGDTHEGSRAARSFIVQVSHAFLLLACLCVAFDPPFSPRNVLARSLGFSLPLLPFYYLSALCVGYYAAYFLLLYRARHHEHSSRRHSDQGWLHWAVPKLMYGLLGISLLGLGLKNVPLIRTANYAYLRDYGNLVVESLPPDGATILSDDPLRLHAVQAALDRLNLADRFVFAVPAALPSPEYRERLQRRWPKLGLNPPASNAVPAGMSAPASTNSGAKLLATLTLLRNLSQTNRLFYLHPGFGYLFEFYDLRPDGLVYEMKSYPTNSLHGHALTPEELSQQERFWKAADGLALGQLREVVSDRPEREKDIWSRLLKRAHLIAAPPSTATAIAAAYSSALNAWGVALQRNGHEPEASRRFREALELNPANQSAKINRLCNSNLLSATVMKLDPAKSSEAVMGKYRKWDQAVVDNGPFDDPLACHELATFYGESRLLRQAGQQLERVEALAPGDITTRFTLAELYRVLGLPDKALKVVASIRTNSAARKLTGEESTELEFIDAKASYAVTNRARAEQVLQALARSHASDTNLLRGIAETLLAYRSYAVALSVVNQSLQLDPGDMQSLINAGFANLQLGAFSNAIPPLTRALSITNVPAARFNRAIAYLRAGQLDAAEADYLELQREIPRGFQFAYGLAEIAFQRKDTNAAVRQYQLYLELAPGEGEEADFVRQRLKALQPGTRLDK